MRRYNDPFCARLTKLFLPERTFSFFRPLLSLHHWYEDVATMIRSTATKYFGHNTETARAGWMTADAWTAIQHRQHVIKPHIPLIASTRASHPFMPKIVENLAIDGLGFPRES